MTIEFKGYRTGTAGKTDVTVTSASIILVYLVDDGEDALDVIAQPEVPQYYSQHPKNAGLLCTSINVSRTDGTEKKRAFEIECQYTIPESGSPVAPPGTEPDPWDMPPFNFAYEPVDNIVAFEKGYQAGDTEGNPTESVVSSSGTPLGANTNKPHMVLRFSYYLRNADDSWAVDFFNTLNNADITIMNIPIKKETGLIRKFKHSLLRDYDDQGDVKHEYYQIDVEIEIKESGWVRELADMSVFMLGGDDMTPIRIYHDGIGKYGTAGFGSRKELIDAVENDSSLTDEEKEELKNGIQPVDEPVTLDDMGGISIEDGKFKPVYLRFQEFFAKSWTPLNLPESRW